MGQTSRDRLKDYLGQLPPNARQLLAREFERSIAIGENVAVATFVLGLLDEVASQSLPEPAVSAVFFTGQPADPAEIAFQSLQPFLVDAGPVRPGLIRRSTLAHVWSWLCREGAPEQVGIFEAALRSSLPQSSVQAAIVQLEATTSSAITSILTSANSSTRQRVLARIAPPEMIDDIPAIASALSAAPALDRLNRRLPRAMPAFESMQIAAVNDLLDAADLRAPEVLPFAFELVMQRISAPWQIVRLAIQLAASDDEIRVASTSHGVAVVMVLGDLSIAAAKLRSDIRRSRFDTIAADLRRIHDGIRGLRTELDLRNDSGWGKQLAAIRADISNALQSQIDSVPGRVRRLLRQRTARDAPATMSIDQEEVTEVAGLIKLVAMCRNHASELAINEVTLRNLSELQHYVEQTTESLVQSLRGDDPARPMRETQARAAIRFCAVLFGDDYAGLMTRAADHALLDARKAG